MHADPKTCERTIRVCLIALGLGAWLLINPAASAQDPGAQREIDQARRRYHTLMRQAEELREAGRLDRAEAVGSEARQLGNRIEQALAKHDRQRDGHTELVEVLEGLEHGMVALRKIGRHDEVERLERVAAAVRRELDGDEGPRERDTERDVVRRRIKIMRYAVEALVEAKRHDAAHLVELAMHARELALEGRRDEEARAIRERAPERGQLAKFLGMAAELLQDAGRTERAAVVGELSREYARQQERRAHAGQDERAAARRQLELARVALRALVEAERGDAAELLERAIHARELALEGRRDAEARRFRERAPEPGQQAEVLGLAARLLRERERPEEAEAVGAMARQLVERLRRRARERDERRPERERVEHAERFDVVMQRVERLEERMAALANSVEELAAAVRQSRRERD